MPLILALILSNPRLDKGHDTVVHPFLMPYFTFLSVFGEELFGIEVVFRAPEGDFKLFTSIV